MTLHSKTLTELWSLHDGKSAEITALYDRIGDNDPTTDDYQAVVTGNKELEEIEHAIKEATDRKNAVSAARQAQAARQADLNRPVYPVPFAGEQNDPRPGAQPDTKLWTPGQQVTDAQEMIAFLKRVASGGATSKAQFGHSPRVHVKDLITGTSSTSAGPFVVAYRAPAVDLPYRPFTIRNLITIGQPIQSDSVEYARVVSRTNAAAAVAEATGTGDGTGTKPESSLVTELVTETVKTIAHWLAISRRALADVGQIRTLIDSQLLNGLEEEWEDQVIAGDGAGENLTGLLNVTGTTAQTYVTNLLTTTRQARTKVRVTGRAMATGYLLHPNDWEDLDLLQDNEARYFFGGPSILGTPRLWGLPVVESEAMTEGTGMVGDFRTVIWYPREDPAILMSDSHSDFFVRNMVALLAEMRGALAVTRPAALVEIDLTA